MLTKKALMSTAVAADSLAIEDVFSTYLYTGNGSTQTITNGIDLAGEGGLVWIKSRSSSASHFLFDTSRGVYNYLFSDANSAQATRVASLTSFSAAGFSLGSDSGVNASGATHASWTFRQAPRFFDVVTYTGTGANRTIAHDLGVVPGCIIVKRTDTTGAWQVYHRSLANTEYLVLSSTAAKATGTTRWNSTTPTSTVFSLGTDATVNASGGTYVAYLFAHDPLGPSGDGSDGLIACGSYTGNGSNTAGPIVNLGWEPQWLLVKSATSSWDWILVDSMRGLPVYDGFSNTLRPNTTATESASHRFNPSATGFQVNDDNALVNASGGTYIYVAIRRGPMRKPTSGTQVLGLNARTGTGANATVTGGLTADAVLVKNRGSAVASLFSSRMTGTGYLVTSTTAAEVAAGTTILQANPWDVMNGVKVGTTSTITNASGNTFINYLFKRAPGFFDVVAYTGNGVAGRTVPHNLGVAPELIIVKRRTSTASWSVYYGDNTDYLLLNVTNATADDVDYWNDTSPTATAFTVGTNADVNGIFAGAGFPYIAYLFASLPGISKVGTYTGNGSSQTIDCGFTGGARFVLIKRTNSTGDWYVWDTARGIVTGNDPHLSLNTTAAEVTTNDTIDPDSTGFIVNQVAATNVNVNTATYIYLAIA
jgi:hypothetical protein